ncbi:hypothetical protein [Atlantibacter hermannii]|uniref:hypothetical protein n=1 Tax=Atlantibacter hermannii TaxID=565 RepID=UPI0022B7955D|nr:hypothetical protein [Atlantibacter hermannii]MCZ7837040.1 hypothetical protein [Atlantibacter hermannii]
MSYVSFFFSLSLAIRAGASHGFDGMIIVNKNGNALGEYNTDELNQHFMIDISKKGNGIR